MPPPHRIHIVGGPGSGKTTLARRLGAALTVPAYELDLVYAAADNGRLTNTEARLAQVHAIAASAGWVSEGIFLWWTAPLFEQADLIIWLDPPWRVAVYRILKRHLLASLAGANRHPGLGKLWRFVLYAREYWYGRRPPAPDQQDDRRRALVPLLATYRTKTVTCRGSAACERLVRRLVAMQAIPAGSTACAIASTSRGAGISLLGGVS